MSMNGSILVSLISIIALSFVIRYQQNKQTGVGESLHRIILILRQVIKISDYPVVNS